MKCSLSVLERKRKANKAANKALHKIGEKLGIPIDLTTYVARHSYATVLKRSGVSTAIISESLGQSLVTWSYVSPMNLLMEKTVL